MAHKTLLTAEDLLRLSATGKRYELVRGKLVEMAPTGWDHGLVVSRIDRRLGMFVEKAGLGEVVSGEPGFRLERDPDTVRARRGLRLQAASAARTAEVLPEPGP